jgi:DNA adenine methylase
VWNDDYKVAFEKLNKMAFQENDNCMEFLIFEDPPYYKTESFYEGFKEQDHDILAKLNHETTHHVILTYNDCPKIRELYADWYILELKNYTTMKWQYNTELLLSNRPLVKRGEKNKSKNTSLF